MAVDLNAGPQRIRACAGLLLALLNLGAAPTHRVDPASGIESWELREQGVSLSLTQILPDQVRGFYLGRGFDERSAELLATQVCVFQTIFRNESAGGPIRFHLGEWRARTARGDTPLRLDADWQREWQRRDVPARARTAFRFALLPTEHTYEVGDWNMGMTLYPLPLGSRFDLQFVWWRGERRHEAVLRGLRCTTDGKPGSGGG